MFVRKNANDDVPINGHRLIGNFLCEQVDWQQVCEDKMTSVNFNYY